MGKPENSKRLLGSSRPWNVGLTVILLQNIQYLLILSEKIKKINNFKQFMFSRKILFKILEWCQRIGHCYGLEFIKIRTGRLLKPCC